MADDWVDDYDPDYNPTDFWDLVAVGDDDIINDYISKFMEPGLSDEQRQDIYDDLALYLDWEYDIQLDDVWDWEEFREAYERT